MKPGVVKLLTLATLSGCALVFGCGSAQTAKNSEESRTFIHSLGVSYSQEEMEGVTRLSLAESALQDDSLSRLSALQKIEELDLKHTAVGGEGLAHLRHLSGLKRLDLSHTKLTEAGLCALRRLETLEELILKSVNLRGMDLSCLGELKRLRKLDLSRTGADDSVLMILGRLLDLESLNLQENPIRGQGFFQMRFIKNLKELDLGGSQVSDRWAGNLFHLRGVQFLSLAGTKITDPTLRRMSAFTALTNLNTLVLSGTKITSRGLENIANLSKLEYLLLDNTGVDNDGIKRLHRLKKLQFIDLSFTKITDECAESLGRVKSLLSIFLTGNELTYFTRSILRRALPDAFIGAYSLMRLKRKNGSREFPGSSYLRLFSEDLPADIWLDHVNILVKTPLVAGKPSQFEVLFLNCYEKVVGHYRIYSDLVIELEDKLEFGIRTGKADVRGRGRLKLPYYKLDYKKGILRGEINIATPLRKTRLKFFLSDSREKELYFLGAVQLGITPSGRK